MPATLNCGRSWSSSSRESPNALFDQPNGSDANKCLVMKGEPGTCFELDPQGHAQWSCGDPFIGGFAATEGPTRFTLLNRPGFRGGSVTWNRPRSGRVFQGSARA